MPHSAEQVVEAFQAATEENQLSPLRDQQIVTLPLEGEVWMTGDLHDHRRNFDRLLRAADLGNNPGRHLVLHELIHGDRFDENGSDGSWELLFRAAALKCDYPSQVHFLLANHDLAQIHGEGIMKAGMGVCEAFNAGVKRDFGPQAGMVNVAITEFLLSFPLAIRTNNGLLFCHSLPTDDQIPTFDYTVFNRPLTGADYKRRVGPVYQLIWGRHMTPMGVELFANAMNAKLIVTGHQPQDMGYAENGERHLIIASDHNQGVFLPVSLSEPYEKVQDLVNKLVQFLELA